MSSNIAHKKEKSSEIQYLENHLENTAALAEIFTSKIGLQDVGRLIGLLHDLGKATDIFNEYIKAETDLKRGDLDHSTAGAQYLYAAYQDEQEAAPSTIHVAYQMLELAIASHHSGLIDCISADGLDNYERRMIKSHDDTHFEECVARIDASILLSVSSIKNSAIESLASLVNRILSDGRNAQLKDGSRFRLGLLNRYILSCLIDADYTDTKNYMENRKSALNEIDWDLIISRYYEYVSKFNDFDKISSIRREVSKQCLDAASRNKGIYTLSVPTGGGKTLSSLRFGLEHLKHHSMERIIYIIPYTSIIDQNAKVIRDAIEKNVDENIVREYHSNIDLGNDIDDQNNTWQYYSDSWDSPIILTTMVQFLETLFSSGTKRTRRMHNLANAVLIFDEIQTLPIKTVHMFNEAINFLVKYCGSTAMLCTATQPLLGSGLDYNLEINSSSEVIQDVDALSESLKRTDIEHLTTNAQWDEEDIVKLALDKIDEIDSLLIITNTKKMARNIYTLLCNKSLPDLDLFHLSTNMCPAHRKKVLEEVINQVGKNKLICVSTQLIEAGIDVDFDSVIRCMAGIDSIVQAAGRCNRNGRKNDLGKVYVVKTNENLERLVDIMQGRKCAESTFREFSNNVLSTAALDSYFRQYFYERKYDMNYRTDNPDRSLFDMLSTNHAAVTLYKRRNQMKPPAMMMRQSFKEANSIFCVIEKMKSIIVNYDDISNEIINKLRSEESKVIRSNLLRHAQHYSINTYQFEGLRDDGAIAEVFEGSGIYYLLDGYYDQKYGLIYERG